MPYNNLAFKGFHFYIFTFYLIYAVNIFQFMWIWGWFVGVPKWALNSNTLIWIPF